jgi:hypothetical protein
VHIHSEIGGTTDVIFPPKKLVSMLGLGFRRTCELGEQSDKPAQYP